ncbi:unnamed protein product [Ranitomeya imitator]|uniref:Uncharacterized protein n=1 Tax=Ranitomeya imitator TaxID=111125 RepID=A0ABN9LE30_9NEOB|nr:unnamed protein product [Ranitomeya imitator]
MLGSFKPMTPLLECPLHGQQLSIANIIIALSRRKLSRKEGTWFHHRAIRTSLRQNSPCSNLRSINLDLKRKRNIWLAQHRGRRKTTLQLLKRFHSRRTPIDHISTLLGQISQRFSNTRKITDEATIKISKAQELLQTLHRCRLSPIINGLDFNRAHQGLFKRDMVSDLNSSQFCIEKVYSQSTPKYNATSTTLGGHNASSPSNPSGVSLVTTSTNTTTARGHAEPLYSSSALFIILASILVLHVCC